MSTMRVKNKEGGWDKIPLMGSYKAVIEANAAAINAQNAAKEVKEIYGDGNFTPLSDLLGSLGTKLKRWGTIFANKVFASNLPIVYNSVAEMKADTMLWEGMNTKTLGYYAPNDGGGASYLIRAKADADVDDGGSLHELTNGLVAELIIENGTVNVKQFGAKGDGVTDDTIAIQKAVNVGETVVIQKGVYNVTNTITLESHQRIYGDGTIYCDSDCNVFYANNQSDIHIDGIKFKGLNHGNKTYYSSKNIIKFYKCNNVVVTNCNFNNIPYETCVMLETCNNCRVLFNKIDGYYYSGIMCLNGCTDVIASYNTVLNGYGTGYGTNYLRYPICLSGYNTNDVIPSSDLTASYNYIEDFSALWEGIDAHGGYNIKVTHNTIKGTMSGIVITNKTSGDSFVANHIVVKDNFIQLGTTLTVEEGFNNLNTGITVTGTRSLPATNVQIVNNIIKNAGEFFIYDNNNYNYGVGAGIVCSFAINVEVCNNIIDYTASYGLFIRGVNNCSIDNNSIDNVRTHNSVSTTSCICVYSECDNVQVYNNRLGFNSDIEIKYGIRSNASTYPQIGIVCKNNIRSEKVQNERVYDDLTVWDKYPSNPSTLTYAGRIGDIAYNSNPAQGADVGWICTAQGDGANKVKSTWLSIGTIN